MQEEVIAYYSEIKKQNNPNEKQSKETR